MNTMRDIAERAYKKAKVLGIGNKMTTDELGDAMDEANTILDELYLDNLSIAKVIKTVTISGRNITIGTGENTAGDEPDITVTAIPERIEQINIIRGSSRYSCIPISDKDYFGRGTDDYSDIPNSFWFNPFDADTEFATINFIGSPNGSAEIVFNSVFNNLNSNSSLVDMPRAMRPYLLHELAWRLGDENEIQTLQNLKLMSNKAYKKMVNSTNQEATNDLDKTGVIGGRSGVADINEISRQVNGGYQ